MARDKREEVVEEEKQRYKDTFYPTYTHTTLCSKHIYTCGTTHIYNVQLLQPPNIQKKKGFRYIRRQTVCWWAHDM
jgi:hypothetical protein